MIRKLLLALFVILLWSIPASAVDFTIPSFTIPNYTRTAPPKVRVYYSSTFTASDGTVVSGGSPNGGVVYKVITCTLANGTVTVPTFTIKSTLDGIDSNSSRVTFYLYDNNAQISPNPLSPYASLMVPATIASATGCSPTGTCASLAELLIWNSPAPPLDPTSYYTKAQVDRLILNSGATLSLTAGSAGSDFNVSGTSPNFTINLPAAGASASGKVTTGTQTFAGNKTISGSLTVGGANNFFEGITVFASLGAPANGAQVYCSNCTVGSSPCTGGGSGAFASRINGAWNCGGGGGSGSVTNVSGTDANGVVWTITNPTTTPNLSIALTDITPSSVVTTNLTADFLTAGAIDVSTSDLAFTGSNQTFRWQGSTRISAPANGSLLLQDNAASTFGLLRFGGSTNAYPALRRAGAGLDVRLADDSTYGAFNAGAILGTTFNKVTLTTPATAATLTLANNSSFITAGAFATTFTFTGATALTFPTSGTLVTTTVTSLPLLAHVGIVTSGSLVGGAVIGPVTMTLTGSDATGDMYYRNASGVLTRIPAGTLSQVLLMGGSSVPFWGAAGAGAVAGSTTQVQYNSSGFLAGATGVLTSGTTLTVTGALNSCADAGVSDTYACSLSPAITAYTTGQIFWFKANTANTGAATINFNSVGAKTIVKVAGGITTTLADNDIRAGQWVGLQYDGTNMQMQSMLGNAGATSSGVLTDYACADAGASDAYACNLPAAPVAYATGQTYWFKANTANTGTATINFNSIGAKTLRKYRSGVSQNLEDNDIIAGQWIVVTYDGTNMQVKSPLNDLIFAATPTGSLQYNSDGLHFGAVSDVSSDGSILIFATQYDMIKISAPSNPSAGKIRLYADTGTGNLACLTSAGASCLPSGTPGGSNTQVQFNNSSAFGGSANLTWASPALTIGAASSATGQIKLANASSANLTTLQAGNAAAARTYTWPTDFGSAGAVLTDAAGNGTLSWAVPAGGGTVTATGGALTANSIVLGAGTTDTKVVAGIITDGTSKITLGVASTSVGKLTLLNATNANALTLQAGATGSALTFTLPTADASGGNDCLRSNESGVLAFGACAGAATAGTMLVFTPLANEPPASNYALLDTRNAEALLAYDDTTNWDAVFSGVLPTRYTGNGLTVTIVWAAASATSGNVIWNAAIERLQDGVDSIASDSFATAQTATCAAPGTSGIVQYCNIAFTSGAQMDSLAAGEAFRLKVTRNAAAGGDTMTGNAQLIRTSVKETP